MLLTFTVKNFRSVRDEQTFSMEPLGRIKENSEVVFKQKNGTWLTTAIVYGKNASGKSNLLRAINALMILVLHSDEKKATVGVAEYEPFQFRDHDEPTELSAEFIAADGLKYNYLVVFNDVEILEEKLSFTPKGKTALLYHRVADKQMHFGSHLKGPKKTVEDLLLKNQLYLAKSSTLNFAQLHVPWSFLALGMSAMTLYDTVVETYLLHAMLEEMYKDEEYAEALNILLRSADTGVVRIKIIQSTGGQQSIQPGAEGKFRYRLKTIHKTFEDGSCTGEKELDLAEESLGTQKFILIAGMILRKLKFGGTLLIDELDKSLHPLLCRIIFQLFHSPKTNPDGAQLIIATHDTNLLGSDLFRRDQIWITEKDNEGATSIYAVSDIEGVRNDIPLDKWYMAGKFGGIPSINDLELELDLVLNGEKKKTNNKAS
jgi:AAA15 family ATPase/GTPase